MSCPFSQRVHLCISISLAFAMVALPYSVPFCHGALLTSLLLIVIEGHWKQKGIGLVKHPVILCFGLFYFLHGFALLYTGDVADGMFNLEKKSALILIPLGLAAMAPLTRREVRFLYMVFIGTCLIGTFICLGNAWLATGGGKLSTGIAVSEFMNPMFWKLNPQLSEGWIFFSYEELASGIRIHPTYFSLYLVICLVLLFELFHRDFFSLDRIAQVGLVIVVIHLGGMIILLSSKIMTLAFLVLVAIGCFSITSNYGKKVSALAALTAIGLFVAFLCINPVSRYRNFEEMVYSSFDIPPASYNDLSTTTRASLWWVGIKSLGEVNLVWGSGPGDVKDVMEATGKKYNVSNSQGTHDPHNQYLGTVLGLGFVGLIVLLASLGIPALGALHVKDFVYLSFLGVFALLCLTESAFEVQKGIVFFALFNSLLIFHYGKQSPVS